MGHFTRCPEFVIEAVSPGSENIRRDREIKLVLYAREGVDEYWIVDQLRLSVDVHRHTGANLRSIGTLGDDDTLTSPELLPSFELVVSSIWPPTL